MSIAPNSIINGDCLEVMKDIDNHSIDCIIADLPFGITACKWDVVIPFKPLWEQYKRIIKPNGAIALFGSQPFTSALVMSNPKWFKYALVYKKSHPTGFLNCKIRPLSQHEDICIFALKKENYYPQITDKAVKDIRPDLGSGKTNCYGEYKSRANQKTIPIDKSYPRSILNINSCNGKEKGLAPTQKPVALYEYLAKTYTLEGELILDNTAGSGTLAIAAINTNRNYICIEKDEHYFEVMRNRIANHDPNAPVKAKKPPKVPKGQLTLFDGGLAV